MEALFVKLLQLSLPAGALVLAVMGLRLVLRRAPRWTFCLLWGLVALRLICPVSLESGLAWMPAGLGDGTLVEEWTDDYVGDTAIVHDTAPNYDAAAAAVGSDPIPAGEGGTYVVTNGEGSGPPATVESAVVPVLSRIWAAGVIGMALYALVSTLGLRRRLATATRRDKGIRQSEWVPSPFVLGLLRPTIYLPYDIQEADLPHVLAHERSHIRRGDPWWKALGFSLLAVYWFHPLVWVAYALACRDMEAACDEAVVREMDREGRRAYAGALRLGRSHVIYSCLLGQEDYERAFYGTAYADLNGDGRRERYCLGLGPTSGLFTFTLRIYDGEALMAQGTFPTGLTDLCFVQGSGTALQIQATDPDLPSDQSLYDVSLRDGEVTLTEGGKPLEPWG